MKWVWLLICGLGLGFPGVSHGRGPYDVSVLGTCQGRAGIPISPVPGGWHKWVRPKYYGDPYGPRKKCCLHRLCRAKHARPCDECSTGKSKRCCLGKLFRAKHANARTEWCPGKPKQCFLHSLFSKQKCAPQEYIISVPAAVPSDEQPPERPESISYPAGAYLQKTN